jgi:hypothetical protein
MTASNIPPSADEAASFDDALLDDLVTGSGGGSRTGGA